MSHSSVDQRELAGPAARPAPKAGSADRALVDLEGAAAGDALALLTAETERCRDAARQALGSLREAVEALQRSYEDTLASGAGHRESAVGTFVERIVTGATAASEAVAERARAELRGELEQVRAALAAAQEELAVEREQLRALREELRAEQAARAAADAAAGEAEKKAAGDRAALEAQLQAAKADLSAQQADVARLQKQVAHEKAARSRLLSAIQQAVEPTDAGEAAAEAPAARALKAAPPPPQADAEPARTPAEPAEPAKPAVEAPPEVVAYVQHLFTTLEAMYASDVAAGRRSEDLLNRLTQNLRSARNVFRNHIGAADGAELPLFDQQLAVLLADPEESAFCRHLGIAAYECAKLPDGK